MKAYFRRMLAAAALAGMLVPVMGGPAGAISPLPINCTAAGVVITTNGANNDTWTVSGRGSCLGDLEGTYFVDFAGFGSSDTLGLCDQSGVVQNLNINVIGSLTNAATGVPKFFNHDWNAPITTYPLATPFLVLQNSDASVLGAGVLFNHIFLNCAGPTVAQFVFSILT